MLYILLYSHTFIYPLYYINLQTTDDMDVVEIDEKLENTSELESQNTVYFFYSKYIL
jgi:hypothetical protein